MQLAVGQHVPWMDDEVGKVTPPGVVVSLHPHFLINMPPREYCCWKNQHDLNTSEDRRRDKDSARIIATDGGGRLAHIKVCTHACTYSRTHMCARVCSFSCSHAHSLVRTHAHTCTHTHTKTQIHMHTHAHTHTCTHARTHTHTLSLSHTHTN